MRGILLALFGLIMVTDGSAQLDSDATSSDTIILKKPHSAKKATILSAVLPGAGQIYNKKIWKAPIAWAGMGTCVYFIADNRKFFRLYKSELVKIQSDPSFVSTVGSEADLLFNLDKRKRWLDLSYFALAAVYGLQIIDANVDGHLFNYDISPDISLNLNPGLLQTRTFSAGLSLSLNF